ncbi:MAG: hypothetical protein NTW61_05985 [Candidatus Melainabacteria bacterium]|nr:hypothetical protein [Candidatus Melainabacteria bacterium]
MMMAKEIRVDEEGRRWKESTAFSQTAFYEWLLTLACLLPVVLVFLFTSQTLATDWFSAETYPYYKIARALVEGHGYTWFRSGVGFLPAWEVPPLYPCMMAFLMSVLNTVQKAPIIEAFRWLNLTIFMVDLGLLFALFKQWMPRGWAWAFMMLIGVTPLAQTVVTNLSVVPLFWLFSLGAVHQFKQLVEERSSASIKVLAGGMAWSFLALATHTAGIVVLGSFLGITLRWGGFQRFLATCGLSILVLSPWLSYGGYTMATLPEKLQHIRPLVMMEKGVVSIPTKQTDILDRLQSVSTQVSATLVGSESQAQVGWPLQFTKDDWFSAWVNGLRSPFHQNQPLHWLVTLGLTLPVLVSLGYWLWTGNEALLGVLALLVLGGTVKQLLQPVDETLLATMAPWLLMLLGVYLRGGQLVLGFLHFPIFTQWTSRLAPILAGMMVINSGLFMLRQLYVTAALSQQQGGAEGNISLMATAGKTYMEKPTEGFWSLLNKKVPKKAELPKEKLVSTTSGQAVKLQPNQHESSAEVASSEEAISLAPLPRHSQKEVNDSKAKKPEAGALAVLAQLSPPLPNTPPVLADKTVSAGVFPISQLRRWVQQAVPNTAVLMAPNPTQASFFLKRSTVPYPVVPPFSDNVQQQLISSLKEADYLLEERGTVASQWVESVQALSSRALSLAYQDDKGAYRVWKVVHATAPTPPIASAKP